MFKKKNEPVSTANQNVPVEETIPEVQTDGAKSELPDIRASAQAEKEPQGEPLEPSTSEVAPENAQLDKTDEEERPVMNFFKTLRVTPTKPTKPTTNPDVSKDQDTSKVPPPPPPPAPPKMESKAEPAVKKEEAPQAAAAAKAKEPETPGKAKTKEITFGKLFRSKSSVKEEAKPVVVQVDASKASTLEAAARPEPPPAPKPEEKKLEKKSSAFGSLLKPKELLNQMSSKIQAAASSAASSIAIGTRGAAKEPKKESPATHAAAPEAGSSTKVKEEPKPAAAVAAAAGSLDDKSVESADNSSPSVSRKLEKRNSIQLFFKNLGQKRHSDAGVQTEPGAPEKAK
ncbi:breast carcinoma-amplified sequence 1 isoform X2 [Trichomycterus rosablanca]|uniref:breast carcinoma-amplified sequence 1 isoform X2 n=1 Tax=Trichomycterus rosablanca TaxID=2290929 RepID=UPI002F35BC41